jgi:hypothetical protein
MPRASARVWRRSSGRAMHERSQARERTRQQKHRQAPLHPRQRVERCLSVREVRAQPRKRQAKFSEVL